MQQHYRNHAAAAVSQAAPLKMRGAVAAYTSSAALLRAESIGGPFLLVGRKPLLLEMEAGTCIHVRSGSIDATVIFGHPTRRLAAGSRLYSERHGVLVIRAGAVAELEVEMPRSQARAA